MALLDLFDQTAVTQVVRRNIEEEATSNDGGESREFIGEDIAPLVSVQSRVTRVARTDVEPYGMGQFKAYDATPPLFKPKPVVSENVYELVLLEEMERFGGEEWIKLNSNDPLIARGAMLSLWTDLDDADPLADLFEWSAIGAQDAGRYYTTVYLNSVTWRNLVYNQTIRSYLSALGRSIMLPTSSDLQALMREGTANFVINDGGYVPEGATNHNLVKFIPDHRVLLTPGNTLFGNRIADVADGQVLVGGDTGSAPAITQGFQTEIIANPYSKNVFRRAASARIPRIYFPEAFLYATVG
jgi:hypothetical protein